MTNDKNRKETAILGGGCFWCTEAVFLRLRGVNQVTSGYTGGTVDNPTYAQICTGRTGHAEVIRIEFDPQEISLAQVLDVFFHTHDPTTLNRQGADTGTQYRSAIFFADDEQKKAASDVIRELEDSGEFGSPIVTTLEALGKFYPAEEYHQNYFDLNPRQGYCEVVINPKLAKFQKRYKKLLKKSAAATE